MSNDERDRTTPQRAAITRTAKRAAVMHSPIEGACLLVIYGTEIGRRIELGSVPITVGRSARADLQFDEEAVSRNHARIEPTGPGEYRVVDLDSTNGTYVNDVAHKSIALRHGDQVQIGRSILKFLAGGHVESAYHEEIYRLMTVDGLTELLNRRAFEESLGREIGRAQRHGRHLSVCMIDLDHFKDINDKFGHLAGDSVLRQLGHILRSNLRRDDTSGRVGGEEFALILPEVTVEGARVAAEKVRKTVEKHKFEFDHAAIPVTISVGVTERGESETDPVELMRRADEMLYEAKRKGRNRVCAGK